MGLGIFLIILNSVISKKEDEDLEAYVQSQLTRSRSGNLKFWNSLIVEIKLQDDEIFNTCYITCDVTDYQTPYMFHSDISWCYLQLP